MINTDFSSHKEQVQAVSVNNQQRNSVLFMMGNLLIILWKNGLLGLLCIAKGIKTVYYSELVRIAQ